MAPKSEFPGKTSVFSTRVRPDLMKKLKQAVKRGQSVSDEVARRLNRTFLEDDRINDQFGDRQTYMLMRMMADAIHFGGHNDRWLQDPVEFEKAMSAALYVLEAVRPEGDVPADALPARHHQVRGQSAAFNIWRAVKRADVTAALHQGTPAEHRARVMKDGLDGLADIALEDGAYQPGKAQS